MSVPWNLLFNDTTKYGCVKTVRMSLWIILVFWHIFFNRYITPKIPGISGLWMQELDAELWTLDFGRWALDAER